MTFASVKDNQASTKFYLIRLKPARFMNDLLASIGGGQHTATFNVAIAEVRENGVLLTKVSSNPSTGEWSHDESTGLFTVNPTSSPSSSNAIVIFYYLFYTGDRFRVVTEDPEDPNTTKREWLARIESTPTIKNSVENILQGTLEVNSSTITLINNENEFEAFLTDDDSFHKKEVKVWLALDDIANIQKIFDGKIVDISLFDDSINVSINDPFALIQDPALMGDDSNETYFTVDDFPGLDPNFNGEAIPYFIGSVSRYKTIQDTAVTGLAAAKKIDPDTLYSAACTTFSETISTTTNREWGIGRVSTDGFVDFSFTPSAIDNSAGGYTRLTGTSAQIAKFYAGDTFIVNDGGVDRHSMLFHVDRTSNFLYITKEALLTTGDDVEANDAPTVIVTDGVDSFYALYGRDYTTTVTSTSGGNKYLKIDFVNNFEANHAGLTTLDPGLHVVNYRVRPDVSNALHGSVLKSLLESAGLTVNAASITAANSSLNVNANFSIPNFDEGDYDSYLKYLEDILKSTLGHISLNNSFEIEYNLFDAPSSSTEITDTDIVDRSFSIELRYSDIVNQVIAFNPHFGSTEAQEDATDTPSLSQSSNKAKYLHDINKTIRFRHVLESMNSRLSKILGIRAERTAVYLFDTKIANIDNIIGDDFLLSKNGILGNEATKQVTILSLSKNPNKTGVVCTDMLGI